MGCDQIKDAPHTGIELGTSKLCLLHYFVVFKMTAKGTAMAATFLVYSMNMSGSTCMWFPQITSTMFLTHFVWLRARGVELWLILALRGRAREEQVSKTSQFK